MSGTAATSGQRNDAGTLARLRRIALATQGLASAAPFGRGLGGARAAIERLGYVQIDTISVVERAHHHVLGSRVPGYRSEHLHRLLRQGDIFEYWSHAAAYLPMRDYRFALPRMASFRQGNERWIRSRDRVLMSELLQRIRAEGPLRSRDVTDRDHNGGGWWNWKPAKGALEQLFMEGELMVIARDGFEKTYDLTERVLPAGTDTTRPTEREFAAYLVDSTLGAHGCAEQTAFTYLRKGAALRAAVAEVLSERTAQGDLTRLTTADAGTWYVPTRLWALPPPAPRRGKVRVLSPFDNTLIQRTRGQRLFGFDYVIECYLPEAKRQYGYFALPLLWGDIFIGRADAKAHRAERRLEIRHLHLEPAWSPAALSALSAGLREFATFNGCDDITLTRVTPAGETRSITRALKEAI